MNDVAVSNLNARIERLERQNLILKIVGFAALCALGFAFVITKTNADAIAKTNVKNTEIVAQKFTLISPDGKNCGYLGYDAETKNPRLSLKQCYDGTPENIGLMIIKDSPTLRIDASGHPTAFLTADREKGNAELKLIGQYGTDNSSGTAYLSSGSQRFAPQMYLEGREKGRVDLFVDSTHYFRFSDDKAKTRFVINKPQNDNIALRFYDKTGANEVYRVMPKLSKSK